MVGLHTDKALDSAILKVIPTGTELKILNRDGALVLVEDPDGDTGWIDNNYLMNERPARQLLQDAQEKNDRLEVELENAKLQINELEERLGQTINTDTPHIDPKQIEVLSQENANLKQQFKEARLKTGELQARITELRKSMAQTENIDPFKSRIEQLEQENQLLGQQLKDINTLETAIVPSKNGIVSNIDWRSLLTIIAVVLIIGIVTGACLLDYLNRRRHGGYRI
jgi:DNA repair exonuclease SbcCD ATPase subunit